MNGKLGQRGGSSEHHHKAGEQSHKETIGTKPVMDRAKAVAPKAPVQRPGGAVAAAIANADVTHHERTRP